MTAGGAAAWRMWMSRQQREAAEQPRCAGKDAARWNTGHEGNLFAYAVCAACRLPQIGDCAPDESTRGVILAGVAYDDRGRALSRCPHCDFPMPISAEAPQGACKRRLCPSNQQVEGVYAEINEHRPAAYRQQITEWTLAGVPRAEICQRLNLPERGVRGAQTRWGLTGAKLAARQAAMQSRRVA
ncbi:hypothetical protein [Micromonospora sp. NPDC047730]|uniref:hypothetical protein n=1 Tax=Micromonospora sp. NPDC047730 TaxID=3364253 RepID=UPI0037110AC6